MLKRYKSKNKKSSLLLNNAVILIGIILIAIPLIWHFSKIDLSFNSSYGFDNSRIGIYRESNLQSISIPKINAFLKIEEGNVEKNQWEVSSDGAMHFVYSSIPGEEGNIVIYGHNKSSVFGNLDKLTKGDFINLYTNDKAVHKYIVKKIEVVDPDRVDVIRSTMKEVLTIYTCAGLFDSKRLVIKAYPA